MNTSDPAARRRAVVIGAGISGLTAAAALAGHFGQVVVLDRDALPPAAAPRAGTPQANHVHGLLAGGLKALEQLLPGIGQDLLRAGALPLNGSLEVRVERPGFDPYPARDLGVTTIAASRALIEFVLRTHVECLPTVKLQSPCRVWSIRFAPDGSRATGVRVDDADGQPREMNADLVIDASGRGGLTLDLLRAAGRELPPETVIGVDIGYASATYEVPPGIDRPWKGVLTFPQAPQSARGALMLPQEGGLSLLSLGGRGNDKPPGDEAGFLDFAGDVSSQARHPLIHFGHVVSTHLRRADRHFPGGQFQSPGTRAGPHRLSTVKHRCSTEYLVAGEWQFFLHREDTCTGACRGEFRKEDGLELFHLS